MKSIKVLATAMATLFLRSVAIAQIPVELFGGDKKSTLDIMFFRYIKNKEGKSSRVLFFNRNRAGIDYQMTATAFLPQFGFTEAISYNHEKLKGFAPVVVASLLNKGVYPKAGIQFAKSKKDYLVFTWVVAETMKNPNIDFFLLARYTPRITKRTNLFAQAELVNAFPTTQAGSYTFIQRVRLGLKHGEVQYGFGADFTATGSSSLATTQNTGVFLRYEF